VSLSAFALLFSELVQYCQNRVYSVAELQAKLARLGHQVGLRVLDALVAREKSGRRETKDLNVLLFVKGPVWRALFGKEADKLEQANDDDKTYYAGLVEAVLAASGFPAKVSAHWHKGTTLMIKFEEAVIARDKSLEGR
ncbi:PREDICTED: trafficking protein particle complex subunit 5, partial [Fulmarus glacialis]|uniref:trafficking protein particle complex subunit 5 n=1 Tax=Fulmarus glacialis TaxID=30455 RepID=UPI00051AE799